MGRAGTVVFDCDSTLTAVEGIDELARGHAAKVAALTEAAMRGELPLQEVYGLRLDLVRPTRAQVDTLGRRYIDALVPDAREVVAALRAEGVTVKIVSGGLRPAVCALARALGVPDEDVAAVDVHFDEQGEYAGFDAASPLARSGGKRRLLDAWRDRLPRPVLFVGDGITDLEAAPAVDAFIAFAGVARREPVIAAADHVIGDASLAPVLALALGDRPPHDPAARAVYERGRESIAAATPSPQDP